MADLRISELPPLAPADLAAADLLALADMSASETRRLGTKDFLQYGVLLIDDESIPSEKLADVRHQDIAPVSGAGQFLAGPVITGGRVSGRRIAPDDLPPATTTALGGVIISEGLLISALGLTRLAPASVASIGGVLIDPAGGLETDANGVLRHINNQIPPGTRSGITFDEWGHITGAVALVGSDLPAAQERALGGVMIPADSGLAVTGTGELRHSFTTTARTVSGVTIDARGHVTGLAALASADLPVATETTVGGVRVPLSGGLRVDGTGTLTHQAFGTTGTFTKVTVNAQGHITSGAGLDPVDIPSLDASVITKGLLDPNLIGKNAISGLQLADYSISFIQEAQPSSAAFIGQVWLQESSAQLRMWNGNSWMPCGFGAVMMNNLRFGGTFNAATGQVIAVTPLGGESGAAPGMVLPPATAALSGAYFVCTVEGSTTPALPGTQFTVGDWILALDEAQGWNRIDVTNGGGGGGGTSNITLDMLLDVAITNPQQGQVVTYNAVTRTWINSTSADPGFF